MRFEGRGDFHRAFDRRLWIIEEHEGHAVASRNPDELPFRFPALEPLGILHNARQFAHHLRLLRDQQS